MTQLLVSICCQTYNHRDYIKEALESFLMQKTDFSIEILLRDDASTDGTADICLEYAEKYPTIINLLAYDENQYQKGISPLLDNVKRARGKYIAICEGDDYWTDPYKLQKQVSVLETHPKYVGVGTNFLTVNENAEIVRTKHFYNKRTILDKSDNIVLKGIPKTLTFVYINLPEVRGALNKINTSNIKSGDELLNAVLRNYGEIAFIDEVTGAYRQHSNGVYSSKSFVDKHTMTLESCIAIKKELNSIGLTTQLDSKINSNYERLIAVMMVERKFSILSGIKRKYSENVNNIRMKTLLNINKYFFIYLVNKLLKRTN